MSQKYPFKLYKAPELQSSSLVVSWNEDAGNLGNTVTSYLSNKLYIEELGEIELEDFFPLGGISVQNDIATFPESKFFYCEEKNLVIFRSNPPRSEWYKFLNLIIDIAEHYCHTNELYTVGGMVSPKAHTSPRELLAVANSPEMTNTLKQYDLAKDLNYETAPNQRPTLSSYLLWVARKRNFTAASLWVPVPFYMISSEDLKASEEIIKFLNKRFNLKLNIDDLNKSVSRQSQKIDILRNRLPEIDGYISRLESNLSLADEESEKLVREMEYTLRERKEDQA